MAWFESAATALTRIAVLLLTGTMLLPAEAAVFGDDDRIRVPKARAALEQSIGLIFNNQAKTVCTAFCVGPNLIATAAHCLYRPPDEGERADFADFWFSIDRSALWLWCLNQAFPSNLSPERK